MTSHDTTGPRRGPGGAALLWVVLLLTVFAAMGGYMVKSYSTSRMAAVDANMSTRAQLLAESGYRFLSAEYFSAADDASRNEVLDDLHGHSFDTGGDNGVFSLNVTSYFYRLTADPSGNSSFSAAFVGQPGADVPSSGYVALGTDTTVVYEYTSVSHAAGSETYTFVTTDTMPSMDAWTTVLPAVQTTISSTIDEGDDLTLGSGQGAIFPEVNGVFWVDGTSYRYERRDGDTLQNVTAPLGRTFTPIAPATAFVVLNKFLTVTSQGSIGNLAAASTVYEVPLDSSGESGGEEPETTIADAQDFVPDANGLGDWEEVEADGSLAMRSTGERLIDTMNVGEVIHVLVEAAQTIRDAVHGMVRLGWSIVVALLRAAASVLEALGLLDNTIDLPDEIGRYKAFAFFDWWNADFDMIDYWQTHGETLSYDVQAKFAIMPDQDYYMTGLFLRNDNSVENGGETLGVSIIRGDSTFTDISGNGDGIPDALVPVNRAGNDTPLIVLWAQKDLNDDDMITPQWLYTTSGGTVITLWPEEREWLAWAALPTNYCLLDSSNPAWFDDWVTLAVRIDEHVLAAPSGSFSAGDRVNDIRVWLTSTSDCNGGGSTTTGSPADYQLDNRRYGQSRYEFGTSAIHWPMFDMDNFTSSYDYFSMVGGSALQINWDVVQTSPTPTLGITLNRTGSSTDKELNAVIRTDAFTTENYNDTAYPAQNRFPEEVGVHVYGADEGVVYMDDFAMRFKGTDPNTGGGTGFYPPVLN